jgi:hypothetical protein
MEVKEVEEVKEVKEVEDVEEVKDRLRVPENRRWRFLSFTS